MLSNQIFAMYYGAQRKLKIFGKVNAQQKRIHKKEGKEYAFSKNIAKN